ncbi:MAG TPA: hypothetical protein PK513_08820 [Alphaproteobacteria bacterium]|nr:hypothetical protein [Alphaproteobacteria bacterium]USO06428.1 MAG: hypothetical protein H6859_04395 [Rhodospirillales bacterium]HOO82592.1 hypothetical protein [Alphaproteobacteria bacterium]
MKNSIGLLMLLAFLATMVKISAHAGEAQTYKAPENKADHGISYDKEDKKLIVSFAGHDEEEGVLELFVAKDAMSANRPSPLASELNRISPAAGMQFRLEF